MNKDNKDARISIVTKRSDGSKWVRVEALGEDFCIAPKDINDRDDMTYDEAMEALEAADVTTFDKKQGLLLAIYIEQINVKLVEAGGDAFKREWYVSRELWKPVGCADYDANYSWFFSGNVGDFCNCNRYCGYFRSRPFLAYASETFKR